MAAGLDFEIEGLEELERDLTKAIQTAPEKAKETLKGIGKDFKNAAKKRANSELKPHERTGSEKNKAIKRKWGTKVIEENVGATALVWNSARHFHLIENGHNLVRGGKNLLNLVSAYNLTQYDNITAQQGKKSVAEIAQEVIAGAWGNGTERKEKLEAAGYNYAEVQAIVNERAGNKTENKVDNKKSIAEIAQEVVAGKWGNGSERKQRLEAEGYDYAEVQATVNNIMGKSQPNKKNVAEIANEVISGKWGNGSERKEKLEAAGYNYAEVQAKVNEMLR